MQFMKYINFGHISGSAALLRQLESSQKDNKKFSACQANIPLLHANSVKILRTFSTATTDYADYFTEMAISAWTDGEQAELILQCARICCLHRFLNTVNYWSWIYPGFSILNDINYFMIIKSKDFCSKICYMHLT